MSHYRGDTMAMATLTAAPDARAGARRARRARCSTNAGSRMPRSRRSHARSASRAASSTATSPPRRSSTSSRSPTTCASSTACSTRRSSPAADHVEQLERWARGVRRVLPALSGVPGLRALADAPARARAARDGLRVGLAPARPGHRAAASRHVSQLLADGPRGRRRSPSRTPTTPRTCCGRRRSARCTSRASASASSRRRRGSPRCSRSRPSSVVDSCVASALAAAGVRH